MRSKNWTKSWQNQGVPASPVRLVVEDAACVGRWTDDNKKPSLQTKATEVTKMQQLQEWPWIGWPGLSSWLLMFLHHFVSIFTWGFMSLELCYVMLILNDLIADYMPFCWRGDWMMLGKLCLHPHRGSRATPTSKRLGDLRRAERKARESKTSSCQGERNTAGGHGCGWRLWV